MWIRGDRCHYHHHGTSYHDVNGKLRPIGNDGNDDKLHDDHLLYQRYTTTIHFQKRSRCKAENCRIKRTLKTGGGGGA